MTHSCELSAGGTRSLTDGAVGSTLISLAWPILCSGIAEVLDTSVNVMWVGRELGDVSLAALSNANLIWGILFVSAFGISMAGAVWIGRSLGKGDIQGAKSALGTMMSASVAVSVACVLPVAICAQFLIRCLGTPAPAQPQAVTYLRILLLSVPPIYLNAGILGALQAAGDAKTGFYLSLASVLFDAALNPLLIIGVAPLPACGIAGSALATVASQLTLLTALLVQAYRSHHPLRLAGRDLVLLRVDRPRSAALVREGGPMAVQVLWTSIEQMLMISLVNRFGADVTAAYGAVIQLWNLIMMPAAALGVATTSIVAQNVGAGRWDRVRSATSLALAYGAVVTAALVAVAEALGVQLCGVFLGDGSPSLGSAVEINREATWSLILVSGYMVWTGALRAIGAVWAPLVISAAVLAVRFPVTEALLGRWQMQAIWWSFPAAAIATSILAALCTRLRPGASQVLPESG